MNNVVKAVLFVAASVVSAFLILLVEGAIEDWSDNPPSRY